MSKDRARPLDARDVSARLELLLAFCEQAPAGILVFDVDLRYVLVNPQMAAMANTPAEQLLGRSVREVFPEYHALTDRVEHVLATGLPLVGFDVAGSVPGEEGVEHVWSLSAYRLVDATGQVLGVGLTSTEVTAARAADRAQIAAAERLELLAASGELLSGGLDEQATLEGVLRLVVPAVAEWACLHLVDESDGTIKLAALRHGDPGAQSQLELVLSAFQVSTDQPIGAGRVIATGGSEDLPQLTRELLAELAGGDESTLAGFLSLGVSHGVVVPLTAGGNTFGALSLSLPARPRAGATGIVETAEALVARQELISDIALRAALALDNARLYARQRDVAVTLQRSLLPQFLPQLQSWDIAARYLPGAAGTEVGGDFYEAVVRADGRLVFAIGDVMGRGVRAAAVMGQVRAALRGYALEGHAPASVLRRLNVMVSGLDDFSIVTCLVGTLDVTTGDVKIASAGHPPPIVANATAADACAPLVLEPGPPLGVHGGAYRVSRRRLSGDESVVMFTDGLVESRDQPVDHGIARLCRVLGQTMSRSGEPVTADELCAGVVAELAHASQATTDDVAVLVISPQITPK